MADQLLTAQDITMQVRLTKASVYRLIRDGSFPAPLRVGKRAVRWRAGDVAAWIDGLPPATRRAA